jgi:diketogulonate reductase-like aldo/keto reductase
MVTTGTVPSLKLNNGVGMPSFGLGVFQSPPDETTQAVEAAIANGYPLVDTAAAYGNEREVGEAIRHSGIARGEIFITESSPSAGRRSAASMHTGRRTPTS